MPAVAPARDSAPSWLTELGSKLRSLPAKIAALDTEIYAAAKEQTSLQTSLKRAELEMLAAITGEVDPATKKAKFSNDGLRQAELALRKEADQAYILLEQEVSASNDRLHAKRTEHTLACNEFSALKSLSSLYAGWMNSQAAVESA